MTESAEQKRKKDEAMRESERHKKNMNVQGERRYRSHAEQTAHGLAEDMKKEFGDSVEVESGGRKY